MKRFLLVCLAVIPAVVGAFAVGIGVHNAGPRRSRPVSAVGVAGTNRVWNGGDVDDSYLSSADNWSGGVAPDSGDGLTFGGTTRLGPVNDFSVYTFTRLTFSTDAGAFNIGGKAFTLTSKIVNNSANTQTISAAGVTLSNLAVTVNAASNDISITAPIDGSAGLTKTGAFTLTLGGTNTYGGATAINGGTLKLAGGGTTLPVAGAVLWVDASTLDTGTGIDATGTPVSNLGSGGGSFNTGTYDVVASGIGSENALKFDGTSQYLKSTNAYSNSGTTMTLFFVAQRHATGDEYDGYISSVFPGTSDYNDIRNFALQMADGGTTNLRHERNGSLATLSHPSNGTNFINTVKFDGTNFIQYKKVGATSTTSSTTPKSGSFGCTETSIGCRLTPSPSSYAPIYIGEVLIYNSALSDTDRLAVESYLAAKWGISGGGSGSVSGTLPASTAVSITDGAVLDINGANQTIGSLSSADAATSVKLGSGTLTVGDANSTSFSGVISGAGGVTKAGAGTWTLCGTNTYSGGTTVSNGTLIVNGTNSGAGAVEVAAWATFGGMGAVTGDVTYAAGATGLLYTSASAETPLRLGGDLFPNSCTVTVHITSGTLGAGTYVLATNVGPGSISGSFASATNFTGPGALQEGLSAVITNGSKAVSLVATAP